jgi:hypothetical protein
VAPAINGGGGSVEREERKGGTGEWKEQSQGYGMCFYRARRRRRGPRPW